VTILDSAAARYDDVAGTSSDIQAHLPFLRAAARGIVLELGVRGGNSTCAFLAGVEERGGIVWSVDVDERSAGVFQGHSQWRFVLADSRDVDALAAAGLEAPIDVLFVDTIHTYEQVRDELAVWGGRVRPGGLVLFHDTDTYPEIRRAIAEWCRPRHIPYEFRGGSSGLGIAHPGGDRGLRARLAVKRAFWHAWRAAFATLRIPVRVGRRVRRSVAHRG
jgi:hypothetical protein